MALGPATWDASAFLTTVAGTGATAFEVLAMWTVDDPRIEPCPTTGCWLWCGCLSSGGYGSVKKNATTHGQWKAHRAFWVAANGPIAEGLVVDHMCRNRACVNPDHLRVVTQRVNALENSVSFAAKFAKRTHCEKCQSPLVRRRTQRYCRTCKRETNRARNGSVPFRVSQAGYSGVMLYRGRFMARIRIGPKMHNLGVFATALEAHLRYVEVKSSRARSEA